MRIYDEMERMKRLLSRDPETKDRYERATMGGREWLAFSAWIAEDRSRWADGANVRYRDALANWLVLTDIAYVLQFETDAEVVGYLKERLAKTAERETTEERLSRKRNFLRWGLHRPQKHLMGASVLSRSREAMHMGDVGGSMQKSAMKEVAAYLMGCSHGASHWAHADASLYIAWYNAYVSGSNSTTTKEKAK